MSSDPNQNIARSTASGSFYSISASLVTLLLGFVRTTLVLRILLAEQVGLVALALLYVNLIFLLFGFGFDNAFIHRQQVDETVRRIYFSLRSAFTLLAFLATLLFTPVIAYFYPDDAQLVPVMLAMAVISLIKGFNLPQVTILNKQMAFRELSTMNIVSAIFMTITAPTLAWLGWGVWSLVAEQFVGIFSRSLMLVFIYRPWPLRFGWNREIVAWFWDYGKKVWSSTNFDFLLEQFDDWFTATFLGLSAAGFYTKAYEYAGYPRRVVANPLLAVFFPTFAQLQDDRPRLSRAFFRATSLMLRIGGWFSLIFILTASEFIPLLLTSEWTPMIATFQLMIVYSLLNPLNVAAANLLMATGHPGHVLRSRILQAIIFIPAVIGLGLWLNIAGVALAADLMIIIGAIWLFAKTKTAVDYSQRALWFWPLFAMLVTAVLTLALNPLWQQLNVWLVLGGKMAFITAVFGSLLWLTEREQLRSGRTMIWGIIAPMLNERRGRGKKKHE